LKKSLSGWLKNSPHSKKNLPNLLRAYLGIQKTGTLIGNSCYKIRLAISSKSKGKSGGARVITYFYLQAATVYLLTMYDRGEKQDLKPNELKEMINSLELDV